MREISLFFSLYIVVIAEKPSSDLLVETKSGLIEGQMYETPIGLKVNIYRKIPYAKPPIGNLRLAKPKPIDPWNDTLKATSWPKGCIGLSPNGDADKLVKQGQMSEDCLYLNIFMPSETQSVTNPVMFWIHGGFFVAGNTSSFGFKGLCDHVVSKDVIVVTVQYRLSILGFFSQADQWAPGNYGLWDLTMALQWINDNIGAFGGDANRITVYGQNAGAAATSALTISPHSSNLFQYAIMMSGAAISPWALHDSKKVRLHSNWVINNLQCNSEAYTSKILNCLRSFDAATIENMNSRLPTTGSAIHHNPSMGLFNFGPVLDGDFFPEHPDTLIQKTPKKPVIAGVMEREGIAANWYIDINTFNYDTFVEKVNLLLKSKSIENVETVRKLMLYQYIETRGNLEDKDFLVKQYAELIGDELFEKDICRENLLRLGHNWPVWFYNFQYFSPFHYPKKMNIGDAEAAAAFHGMEIDFVFGGDPAKYYPNFSTDEYRLMETITTMWTNFAKYGDPTPTKVNGIKWTKNTKDKPLQYLNINLKSEMKSNYRSEMMIFWFKLLPEIEITYKFKPPKALIIHFIVILVVLSFTFVIWKCYTRCCSKDKLSF